MGRPGALARMKEVLETPRETLARIKDHAQDAFARLYRQRNLILHAGRTRAVALRSVLHGATPLVGAGLDRVCHARFVDQLTPIALARRARTALGTVQPGNAAKCTTLLGDSYCLMRHRSGENFLEGQPAFRLAKHVEHALALNIYQLYIRKAKYIRAGFNEVFPPLLKCFARTCLQVITLRQLPFAPLAYLNSVILPIYWGIHKPLD